MNVSDTYISYVFQIVPNNSDPVVNTFIGCVGKREIALGGLTRMIYLDPNTTIAQMIKNIAADEISNLTNAFSDRKTCSGMITTSDLNVLKGSVCWYPTVTMSDISEKAHKIYYNNNWREGLCELFIRPQLPRNITLCDYNIDIREDQSVCYDPNPSFGHSYSFDAARTLNGYCHPDSTTITDSIGKIVSKTNEAIREVFVNLTSYRWRAFGDPPNCTVIERQCTSNEDESSWSTGTIITVSLLGTVCLFGGAYLAYQGFKKWRSRRSYAPMPT